MVGLFEWADRIQNYQGTNDDGSEWNYIEELKKFTDGGYQDWSFADAVSGIVNIGCHNPPCKGADNYPGYSTKPIEPHNKRDRNDTFQRFMNVFQVARNFRPPPAPTPMPSYVPTDEPTNSVPTTSAPTEYEPPTAAPTISPAPTAIQGKPPTTAADEMDDKVIQARGHFEEVLLWSEHPTGIWPSYLYKWHDFRKALKLMTTGVGAGEGNWFYIGDGTSANSLNYGLVNTAAFIAQGVVQAIGYDACDENSWEMVNFRYPVSNSCGQGGNNYQDDVCTDTKNGESESVECEVDTSMDIFHIYFCCG